jgi:hypothetical protein
MDGTYLEQRVVRVLSLEKVQNPRAQGSGEDPVNEECGAAAGELDIGSEDPSGGGVPRTAGGELPADELGTRG